jgi:hypothetical protein
VHFGAGETLDLALDGRPRRIDPPSRQLSRLAVKRIKRDLRTVHIKPSYDRHLGASFELRQLPRRAKVSR